MGILKFSPALLAGSSTSLQGWFTNWGNVNGSGVSGNLYLPPFNGPTLPFLQAGGPTFVTSVRTNVALVRIMSGPRPTDIETLTNASILPAGTSVLWQLGTNNVNTDWAPTGSLAYNDPTSISSVFTLVGATGVASWFWILTTDGGYNQQGGFVFGTSIYFNITGTVGLVGSGSDMEMLNTSLTAGQYLRILNLKIRMPTNFY
jgi:hypothetical protein